MPIVGLAADAVYSVSREPIPPTMYVPLEQRRDRLPSSITLSVRAATLPASLTKSITAAIAVVDRNLVLTFRPLADQLRTH